MHELHGDEVRALRFAQLENLHDVRVLQERRQPRLVQEHLHEGLIACEMRENALHGDRLGEPLRALLLREKHLAHAA